MKEEDEEVLLDENLNDENLNEEETPQGDGEKDEHQEEKNLLFTERMNLESQLAGGDYKIVKCAEAVAVGLPMPYDVAQLHAERLAMRNRINAIDAELKVLDGENPTDEELLAATKSAKIRQIEEYDISANVNAFTVNGEPMWLNFDLRSRLQESINSAVGKEEETMTKYYGGRSYTFPVAAWQQMLDLVKEYAVECEVVTEHHKAEVLALESVGAVEAYDITTDYPPKKSF